jgi:ABC-type proline/glycine betaine transport system substrate-binding protein
MMKKYFYLLALVCATSFFTACSDDDDDNSPKYETITFEGSNWNALIDQVESHDITLLSLTACILRLR